MNKAEGAGRQGRYKAEGVGCHGMYEAMGSGRWGKFKGGGTGRHDQDQDTSDTSSSMNNSRGSTSVKDTLEKRRMQVQEGDGERDGDNNATTAANDEGNGEDGADDDQVGEAAAESRPDIQARLRKAPGIIVAETWANRAQRTRVPTNIYQAGTKKEVKKPGRGRGRR